MVSGSDTPTVYDRGAERRAGDQVLAWLPIVSSPFQDKFMNLFTVVKQPATEQNYLIAASLHMPKNIIIFLCTSLS